MWAHLALSSPAWLWAVGDLGGLRPHCAGSSSRGLHAGSHSWDLNVWSGTAPGSLLVQLEKVTNGVQELEATGPGHEHAGEAP